MASAPRRAACRASSSLVMPQILMRSGVIAAMYLTGARRQELFCSSVHRLDRAGLARLYFHIFLKGIKPMKTHKPAFSSRLIQVEDQFVDLWDTMSRLWGISSTMARIHGLLYITG